MTGAQLLTPPQPTIDNASLSNFVMDSSPKMRSFGLAVLVPSSRIRYPLNFEMPATVPALSPVIVFYWSDPVGFLAVALDLYGFLFCATPEEGVLSLQDLHLIVNDIWLTRFDEDLEKIRSARRKSRPKSSEEIKLDFKKPSRIVQAWDKKELAFMQRIRFIRISEPEVRETIISHEVEFEELGLLSWVQVKPH
ncbi:hypothetical protein BYT27DRAFT_7238006 [Phlegmacium glaucopus]|nr:hypothetical protein BYT27DRAFT_7238006 [Phlegmacium glaucopus]